MSDFGAMDKRRSGRLGQTTASSANSQLLERPQTMKTIICLAVALWTTTSGADERSKPVLPAVGVPNPPLDANAVARITKKISTTEDGKTLAALYEDLASEYGRSGRWKEAADHLRRASEENPKDSGHWMRCGVALLLAKDHKTYKSWVEKMAKQFAGSESYYAVEKVAKMCTLSRDAIGKKDDLTKLAATSVRNSKKSPWAAYFPSTQAIVHYRFGKYDDALKSVRHSDELNKRSLFKHVTAINLAVAALCRIKQGKPDEAIKSLKIVNMQLRRILADTQLVQRQGYWHDWMIAKLLYEEAVGLLEKKSRREKRTR